MASTIIMRGVSETYVWWYGDSYMTWVQECAPFILRRELAYIAAHSLLEIGHVSFQSWLSDVNKRIEFQVPIVNM